MSNVTHKSIALTKLLVSTENPRYEPAESQREAIGIMINDQEQKLIKLANDIINFGLNPAKFICVVKNNIPEESYTVLEGNRRVTALKILHNPSIISNKHQTFAKKIQRLSDTFKKKPLNDVNCAVFPDVDSALKWIELEHTGENEGVGIVSWDAQQRARFDKKVKGTTPLALQAIELLQNSEHTDKKIKKDLSNLTSSNLERLLADPDVRKVLGLQLHNKELITDLQEKEVVKGLSKIANDFLFKDYTVYQIDKKKDRKEYIETFTKPEIPRKNTKANKVWSLSSGSNSSNNTPITKGAKRSVKLSYDRTTLIPKECIIHIKDKRNNHIYHELKDIDVEEFTNASAVLFRVFIELSIDCIIKKKKGKIFDGINKMTPLKTKIERVIQYFKDSNLLTKDELLPISMVISSDNSMLSIDTFHAYVHNADITPSPKELKISWDRLQSFIQKLWEVIA